MNAVRRAAAGEMALRDVAVWRRRAWRRIVKACA
jgi:hypothetical protein